MNHGFSRGYWVTNELPQSTAKQIEGLVSCWKRDRQRASLFIEAAKRPIKFWLSFPAPSESATETRERAADLKVAAHSLNRNLANASRSPDFLSYLQAHIRDQTVFNVTCDVHSLLESLQGLAAYHNAADRPEPPDAFDIRDVMEPLQGLLTLIAGAAGGMSNSIDPKPGRNLDHERELIRQLVACYRKVFGKMPGKSAESPLMQFWEGLRPIIGTASSYRVVLEHIRQLENQSRL